MIMLMPATIVDSPKNLKLKFHDFQDFYQFPSCYHFPQFFSLAGCLVVLNASYGTLFSTKKTSALIAQLLTCIILTPQKKTYLLIKVEESN